MNLDLLIKLTKLANNNPNEHEANSAARRVCKMLEECKFKLEKDKQTPKDSKDIYSDIMDVMKYYDREYDIAYKQNPYTQPIPYHQWQNTYTPPKKRPEQRERVCVRCNKTKFTPNINNVFVCNDCQWTEYKEKQR